MAGVIPQLRPIIPSILVPARGYRKQGAIHLHSTVLTGLKLDLQIGLEDRWYCR